MPAAGPSEARRSEQRRTRTILGLFGAGVPVEEIGRRLSLRRRTVRGVLRDAGVPVDDAQEEGTKGATGVSKRRMIDLEELEDRMSQIEISLAEEEEKTRRWIESRLDDASGDPEFARRAQERGLDLGDALVELAHELERPYGEIFRRRAPAIAADDARLDRKARRHAERHNVPYAVALEAVTGGEEARR